MLAPSPAIAGAENKECVISILWFDLSLSRRKLLQITFETKMLSLSLPQMDFRFHEKAEESEESAYRSIVVVVAGASLPFRHSPLVALHSSLVVVVVVVVCRRLK